MKRTTILTAKIADEYAALIASGLKKYEVRSESLEGIDAIRLVSCTSGQPIQTYRVLGVERFSRDEDDCSMDRAAIGRDGFYRLFPPIVEGGPNTLWAAELGEPVTLEALVG